MRQQARPLSLLLGEALPTYSCVWALVGYVHLGGLEGYVPSCLTGEVTEGSWPAPLCLRAGVTYMGVMVWPYGAVGFIVGPAGCRRPKQILSK